MNWKCYLGTLLVFGLGFGAGFLNEKNLAEKHLAAVVKTTTESAELDARLEACQDTAKFLAALNFPIPLGCQVDAGDVYYVSPAIPGKEIYLDGRLKQ